VEVLYCHPTQPSDLNQQAIGSEAVLRLTNHGHDKARVAAGIPEDIGAPGCNTLLMQRGLMTVIDECHTLRNVNNQYRGVLRMTVNSDIAISASATPVFTGAKVNMNWPEPA
jgi:hypothetical protein